MKIILLCDKHYNQVALANKICEKFDLIGVVIEDNNSKRSNVSLTNILKKVFNRLSFIFIRKAWQDMLDYYKKTFSNFPKTKTLKVNHVNSEEVVKFIKNLQPDLLVVSGTSLIKKNILEVLLPKGIINLHTGLSPYIKGSPNCTNWCIAENKFHLIGNTVMWIDKGIDSGDIITTEITDLTGDESLSLVHIKVMEHAHDLTIRTLQNLKDDFENCPRVQQSSIDNGRTYFNKQWDWKTTFKLYKNFRKFKTVLSSEEYHQHKKMIKTIKL